MLANQVKWSILIKASAHFTWGYRSGSFIMKEISGLMRCWKFKQPTWKRLFTMRSKREMSRPQRLAKSYTTGVGRSCLWSPIKMRCWHSLLSVVTTCASKTSAASSTITIRGPIAWSAPWWRAAAVVVIPMTVAFWRIARSSCCKVSSYLKEDSEDKRMVFHSLHFDYNIHMICNISHLY